MQYTSCVLCSVWGVKCDEYGGGGFGKGNGSDGMHINDGGIRLPVIYYEASPFAQGSCCRTCGRAVDLVSETAARARSQSWRWKFALRRRRRCRRRRHPLRFASHIIHACRLIIHTVQDWACCAIKST